MNSRKRRLRRLLELLSAAHKGKPEVSGPADVRKWQAGVMRSVRAVANASGEKQQPFGFIQLAWRLSPAAALLLAALSFFAVRTGSTIDHQLAALSIAEPAQTYLACIPF
jgi:hypothetical protein